MKNVFLVLEGNEQLYFLEQENAEKRATETKGDLVEEPITEKRFKDLFKKGDFFQDQPTNGEEKKEEGKNEKLKIVKEQEPNLKLLVENLTKENEQLKKEQKQNLSFEDAAQVYKLKSEIFKKISVFETTLETINNIKLEPSRDNEFNADYYSVTLNRGSYASNETQIFRITNIDFIKSFIEYSAQKINSKIVELKAEVQAI